jgi:xanthine dehydrogenase YagR molybdenum-binding subunit
MKRIDAGLKAAGQAAYAADNNPDRLAYGYLITATIGLGTITAMDPGAASAAPGVLAIYTPFNPLKLYTYTKEQNDELTPPIQDANVRYYGQAIGLVVAETFEQARDAASLVAVSYDPRTPAASFRDGLDRAGPPPSGSPVSDVLAPGVGSIDEALAASEVTISATYTTTQVSHNAMEPHPTVAAWTDDHLTIYTATQGVKLVVDRLANALGVDAAKIHVLNPYVGGGFGNKWGIWAHTPLTAAAARALGRPVKTVLTREQAFTVVGHRPASYQTVALGAGKDGVLNAIKHDGISSKSASNGFYEPVANLSMSLYASANLHTGRKVVTLDVPVNTIMRAPQEANGSFALESAMDELAEALGMDPLALRMLNDTPLVPSSKLPWSSKHLEECYRVGAERFGWSRRASTPGSVTDGDWLVGMGMATATYSASRGQASTKVRLQADGTATVSGTGADLGTGQSTVWAILLAGGLGIPVSRARAELGDSAAPTAANAGGSGSTSTNGPAVQAATDAAKTAMIALAVEDARSPFHGMDPAQVSFEGGRLKSGTLSVPFEKLLTDLDVPGVEATATSPKNSDKEHGFRSFGAHFCEVRVNRWTREPRVSRWLTVLDAGKIVNPTTARNQIMGGVVMGIGQALMEETRIEPDTGRFANANLADYLVPVNADIPHIDVQFLDYPDTLLSALGARGIGEFGIVGTAGAVANAIHNATGRRIRDLPITLEKLLT